MREVRDDRRRSAKVERAHAWITTHYEAAAVGRTYRERIDAIRAGRGAETLSLEAHA